MWCGSENGVRGFGQNVARLKPITRGTRAANDETDFPGAITRKTHKLVGQKKQKGGKDVATKTGSDNT